MDNQHEKTKYSVEPAESFYQTGSTKPPKSYTGLVLILLGIVIFLGGIVTAMGVTNFRLFQALEAQNETMPNAIGFSSATPQIAADNARPTGLGFRGETVSEFWHTYHQLPRGIFIQAVDPQSDAARQGVLPGDILIQINDTPVTAIEELPELLETAHDPIKIVLHRNREEITLLIHRETD